MANLELVLVLGDEQEYVMKIGTKQFFSAVKQIDLVIYIYIYIYIYLKNFSAVKQIDLGYLPLHKFIQQPTPTLRSFVTMYSNNSKKMLIPRISDQQDGNEGTSIPTVPLSGK
ncbi:hypothetical protein ACP275_10G120700 [Erythranthe tilingii]